MPENNNVLVTRSSMPPLEEYINEIAPLWDSHWLTNMGAKHQEFEQQLKAQLEVDNIALFTNGHNALECILEALELPKGGEVITTPFTFASTAHAIARKGLTPVFADIKPDDFTLDPTSVEEMITPRTCAILPVHVYGFPCDVNALQQVASEHDLKLIYDAAHAFNVKLDGTSIATYGDASMFSFHATKVFNTIEGGAVCFRDASLYDRLNEWKNFGITGPESVVYIGGNAKMNEFCAAMGICNLRHLDEEIKKRKHVAERYWHNLEGLPGITTYQPQRNLAYNYAYLPITVDPERYGSTRDQVFEALAQHDIHARKYFYPLVSDYECYRSVYASERTPVAARAAQTVLTLPMYADLELQTVDFICEIIRSLGR